jgi:hypothetical protein
VWLLPAPYCFPTADSSLNMYCSCGLYSPTAPCSSLLISTLLWQNIQSAGIALAYFTALLAFLYFLVLTPSRFIVQQVLLRRLWSHCFVSNCCVPSWQIYKVPSISKVAMAIPAPLCFIVLPPGSRFQRWQV